MKRSASKNARSAVQLALVAGLSSAAAQAADSIFLQVNGLSGESTDAKHPGWSDVLSFSQAGSNRNCPRFFLSKTVDKVTPVLSASAINGDVYASMTLAVQTIGAKSNIDYLTVKMTNVVVQSSQQAGASGAPKATEEIVLAPASVSIEYRPILPDGSIGVSVVSSYACKGNG